MPSVPLKQYHWLSILLAASSLVPNRVLSHQRSHHHPDVRYHQETTSEPSTSFIPPLEDDLEPVVPDLLLEEEIPTSLTLCPGCAEEKQRQEEILSVKELRKVRIEVIKELILKKLRLKAPPQLKVTKSVLPSVLSQGEALRGSSQVGPQQIQHRHRHQGSRGPLPTTPPMDNYDSWTTQSAPLTMTTTNVDDYYGTIRNVVIFSENGTVNRTRHGYSSTGLTFRISLDKLTGSVTEAELWIFKTSRQPTNQSLVISELVHDRNSPRTRIIYVEEPPFSSGWLRFNVGDMVRRWVTKPHLTHALEITCKGCSRLGPVPVSPEERYQPFLVITTGPPSIITRKRREADCTETSTRCCKETFYLSFKEIGWDDWIIQPPGYTANFCRGKCLSDVSMSRYHHTTVLQRYIQSQKAKNEEPKFSLCCTPSRMSSISLIYINDDNSIFQKSLPNMVVEACDCA